MFFFEKLLKAIQLLTRKAHTLTYINTIYYVYLLQIDQVEKRCIECHEWKCIHFWRHNQWNSKSIWKWRHRLSRDYALGFQFSFPFELLMHLYFATNMWLQFARVMENKLLGQASDKFSMTFGQNIRALVSMAVCESDPRPCASGRMQSRLVKAEVAVVMNKLRCQDIFLNAVEPHPLWGPEMFRRVSAINLTLEHFQSWTGDSINLSHSCCLERASGSTRWLLLVNWF